MRPAHRLYLAFAGGAASATLLASDDARKLTRQTFDSVWSHTVFQAKTAKVKATQKDEELAQPPKKKKWKIPDVPIQTPEGFQTWDDNYDLRNPIHICGPEPEDPEDKKEWLKVMEKYKPKAKRGVILVRHGQYEHSDKPEGKVLTELGKEQVSLTAKRLNELLPELVRELTEKDGLPVEVRLIKSPIVRAMQSGDILEKEMPDVEWKEILVDELIAEGAPWVPDPPHPTWKPKAHTFFEEGGRMEAGFRKYIHRADRKAKAHQIDVLSCHGNVTRFFFCRALQFPPGAWLRFNVANGSYTLINMKGNGHVVCEGLAEDSHMPVSKRTFN